MRLVGLLGIALVACADPVAPPAAEPPPDVWSTALRDGDLVVLVPGTGAYDYLAATIEPMGENAVVDVRAIEKVADDSVVFEQAIAAAHRANVPVERLHFVLWGSGFSTITRIEYVSYEGLHVPIEILGGKHSCAVGGVDVNLLNYSTQNAASDADDLYVRSQAWLAAHPGSRAYFASHSWGGAIAEWLAFHRDEYEAAHGPLAMSLVVAMGVPAWVVGYNFAGPSFRDLDDDAYLYEIDRPDDPVHAMNPSGAPWGHHYNILFGDEFLGSYGITTDELSCRDVPGPCSTE